MPSNPGSRYPKAAVVTRAARASAPVLAGICVVIAFVALAAGLAPIAIAAAYIGGYLGGR
jgi:hypothetical protein